MKNLLSILSTLIITSTGCLTLFGQNHTPQVAPDITHQKVTANKNLGDVNKYLIHAAADFTGTKIELTLFNSGHQSYSSSDFEIKAGDQQLSISWFDAQASELIMNNSIEQWNAQAVTITCLKDGSSVNVDMSAIGRNLLKSATINHDRDSNGYFREIKLSGDYLVGNSVDSSAFTVYVNGEVWSNSNYMYVVQSPFWPGVLELNNNTNLKEFDRIEVQIYGNQPVLVDGSGANSLEGYNEYASFCLGSTLSSYYSYDYDLTEMSNYKYFSWSDFQKDHGYFAMDGDDPYGQSWASSTLLEKAWRPVQTSSIIKLSDTMDWDTWNNTALWNMKLSDYHSQYAINSERDGNMSNTLSYLFYASYWRIDDDGHVHFGYGLKVAQEHDWNWYGGDRKYHFECGDTVKFF